MVKKLSSDPVKRRYQIFRRLYEKYYEWGALIESEGISHFMFTPDGEEVYRGDLLIGFDSLKPNQKIAFDLLCLRGMTETQAQREQFNGRLVPVQQHADTALKKMVKAYDEQQQGGYVSPEKKKRLQELERRLSGSRRDGLNSSEVSPTTRLGSRQRRVLSLLEEKGQYYKGCSWKYSSHSETVEILDSLVLRNLVIVDSRDDRVVYQLFIELT